MIKKFILSDISVFKGEAELLLLHQPEHRFCVSSRCRKVINTGRQTADSNRNIIGAFGNIGLPLLYYGTG